VLVFAGASGIGKTRLVEETLALARERGFTAMSGAARVLGGSQAYAVWLEALAPGLSALSDSARARLVDGLSDLGRLLVGLDLPSPVPLLDPGLERTRLFEAVARLLARMAEGAPLVIAFDDLHWMDRASVELLHYVARGVDGRRILLVTAYRTDEVDTTPEVLTLVRDLRRDGLLDELRLAGLDAAAVQALAATLLGGDPPDAFVASVVARTVGSPLMITALIDELRATGGLFRSGGTWVVGPGALDVVPAVMGDLARGRLRRLTAQQRTLLELVAVAGDAATAPVLADALGTGEESVLGTARELSDLAVVAEVAEPGGVRYIATHPVYAEVAYGELPESIRRRRHGAVAAALERRCPEDVGLLAPHYLGGQEQVDSHRALHVLTVAGDGALAVHAGAEAARYLTAARRLAAAGGDQRRGTTLAEHLGGAWQAAGRMDAAVEAWAQALDGYRQLGEVEAVARVGRQLASALCERGQVDAAGRLLDEVLDSPEPTDAGSELLLVRELRLRLLATVGEIEAFEAAAAELRDLGGRLGSSHAMATVDLFRAELQRQRGEYVAARRLLVGVLATAERLGDPVLASTVQRPLIGLELALDGPRSARSRALDALALARTGAIPALEGVPRLALAIADFFAGDWEESWRSATELLSIGHRIASRRGVAAGLAGRALVFCHRGELAAAAQCLAEARAVFGGGQPTDRHVFSFIDTLDAMVLLHRGAAAAIPVTDGMPSGGLLLPELHLAVLGETQLAAGAPDAALETADRIARLGPGAPLPAAIAGRLAGLVHRARGDLPAAAQFCVEAADVFSALGMPFEAARCRLEWALAAGGEHPHDAVDRLQEALRLFVGLGARQYADRARHLLRELGAQPAPGRRPPAAGLSQREVEVVRLVAEGLSNTEIARRLVISPRTVTTHLQHVYARLGIGSRAALVRYAIEEDLLGPSVRTGGQLDT
jgi:DNA-binding CsgD family transcriptional regulator/tetratricopeptide (TPR) repeat protein